MPSTKLKNRPNAGEETFRQTDGFYVHSSPPKVFQVNSNNVRQWLKNGDLTRLEEMVVQGRGRELIGQYSPEPRVRYFLKQVPALMAKINEAHEATARGDLATLRRLTKTSARTAKNIISSKKGGGLSLLHKAVYYGHPKIVQFLITNAPESVNWRDCEGRTGLHYCGSSAAADKIWTLLTKSGADSKAMDSKGRTPSYYMERGNEIGLPMERIFAEGIPIKASNIRIWIHDRDLDKLQRLIWEGHGGKLLMETSNNPTVKRFLEGVPHALSAIRGAHLAVINDDLEEFVKRTSGSAPRDMLASKDVNGLNPLHKAAGLGRLDIVKYIVERDQDLVHSIDGEGRTPLHYAATYSRTDDSTYRYLLSKTGPETPLDMSGKTPAYYKTNPKEIAKYLQVVPEAPRTPHGYPFAWDWVGVPSTGDTPPTLAPIETLAPIHIPTPSQTHQYIPSQEVLSNDLDDLLNGNEAKENDQNNHDQETLPPSTSNGKEEEDSNEDDDPDDSWTTEERSNTGQKEEVGTPRLRGGSRWSNEDEDHPKQTIQDRSDAQEYYEIWTNKDVEPENEAGDNHEETVRPREALLSTAEKPMVNPEVNTLAEMIRPNAEEAEVPHQKTPREIGEERQRLLDEGLIKVDYDNEEEDDQIEDDGDQDSAGRKELVAFGGASDEDVNRMIDDGDMEALASVILNGEGHKLMGKFSENPKVQAFLENLPSYMSKIAAVHRAVRCGSLRDLQTALDRRRFAVAKEITGKLGLTPLHVAVLLQKPQIVKYLGGRFPETLNFKDDLGRTPLHYAAVLPDDSHLFNLLLNLGSDRRIRDNEGLRPGDYRGEPANAPTHATLLEEYDAPTHVAKDMLTGQDYILFGAEDGKYLAEAVGGPLVRGLTRVASKRPGNPVAYLADYLYETVGRKGSGNATGEEKTDGWGPTGGGANPGYDRDDLEEEAENLQDEPGTASNFAVTERDEFGQSILHFAAARAHGRTGLFHLIQESGANLGCRDELYRTARDVAMQANIRENMNEIDKYVISLAARGETEKIKDLYLEGYDHIVDLKDDEAADIVTIASNKNQQKTAAFLRAIPTFEANRERMHEAIRGGNLKLVRDVIGDSKTGKLAVIGKNTSGRCSLHIAVLCQQKEITEYLAQKYPESLKIGDNLERTAMHYAMGVDEVETLSKILIKCGAQRISKDLKGRQPTYYFMNKSEILKLQEEESC